MPSVEAEALQGVAVRQPVPCAHACGSMCLLRCQPTAAIAPLILTTALYTGPS